MFSWKMLVMFLFGFSSGFPFYIIKNVLVLWMTKSNVDLGVIGLFALVGLPYNLKIFWSPIMDGVVPKFLGRRRGWILMAQIGLIISIICLGQFDPQKSLLWIAVAALSVNFFGASQDIALDAFRREYLTTEELGLGTGIWVNAWRLGMFAAVGISLLSKINISWATIHIVLASVMSVGIVTTLCASEPDVKDPPASIKEAVIDPFLEFFKRDSALLILLFILLYKIGDNMASAMTIPYIIKMGFTETDYFVIVKGLGMFGLFGGVLVGGTIMIRLGIAKSLYVFGFLQAISTAFFVILNILDHSSTFWISYSQTLLAGIVGFEFFATGMGQAAYASYMAIQTHKKYTATQYALFTCLMAIPGTVAAAITGYMAKYLGWNYFYFICAFMAIPGILLLFKIAPWQMTNAQLEDAKN